LTGPVVAGAVGIAFLAAGTQSLTGFGFALVMVPFLSLIWDVKAAVVTSTVLATVAAVPLALEVRRSIRPWKVAPLLLGSLVGIPIGIVILDWIDPQALKIFVAAVVIAASFILYFGPRLRLEGGGVGSPVVVGMLSGVLRGSTSMGGPPAVLYVLSRERGIEEFRSTILAFFLPSSLLALTGMAIAGWVTPEVLGTSGVALPALAAGLLAGAWLRSRVQQEVFRTVALAVLVLTGIAIIISVSVV
jgi:uncharacterized membrane protein YfcA